MCKTRLKSLERALKQMSTKEQTQEKAGSGDIGIQVGISRCSSHNISVPLLSLVASQRGCSPFHDSLGST
jgi:hypothetical protein